MEEKRIRVVGWQDQYQNYENYERCEYVPCNPDYDKTFGNLEEAMEFYNKIILEDIKVEWKNKSFYVENKSIFYCDEDGNETEEIENVQSKVIRNKLEEMIEELKEEILGKELTLGEIDNIAATILESTSSLFDAEEDCMQQCSSSYYIEEDKNVVVGWEVIKQEESNLDTLVKVTSIWED